MHIDQIHKDLKEAQLAHDDVKVSTLRLLLSEVKNAEIAKGGPLSEEDIISVVQREVKKRKEAAGGFRQGNREEQAQKEEAEMNILQTYLPVQLEVEELTKLVEGTINELGAKSVADMGRVMGSVMSKVSGRADGNTVSNIVKGRLSQR